MITFSLSWVQKRAKLPRKYWVRSWSGAPFLLEFPSRRYRIEEASRLVLVSFPRVSISVGLLLPSAIPLPSLLA